MMNAEKFSEEISKVSKYSWSKVLTKIFTIHLRWSPPSVDVPLERSKCPSEKLFLRTLLDACGSSNF